MVQKICPICDQVMKRSHYCRNCRSWVRHPYEREVTYYLNERHPENETVCSYHGRGKGQPEDKGRPARDRGEVLTSVRSQVRGNTSGWIPQGFQGGGFHDARKQPDFPNREGYQVQNDQNRNCRNQEYRNRNQKRGNPVLRTAAVIVAVVLAAFLFQTGARFARRQIFSHLAGRDAFVFDEEARPWEMEGDYEEEYPGGEDWWNEGGEYPGDEDWWNEGGEYPGGEDWRSEEEYPGGEEWWQLEPQELTDEEAIALGITCQGEGHFAMQGAELEEIIRQLIREQGYQEGGVRRHSYNTAYCREDGECINSFFSSYLTFPLLADRERMYKGYVNMDYDTATGELHEVEIFMQDEEDAIEMAAGILEGLEQGCGRTDGIWSSTVRREMPAQLESGEWYDWTSDNVWISGNMEETGCWISIDMAE